MLCPNCQSQVAAGLPFCPECGSRLPAAEAATPVVAPPPPPLLVLQGRYELVRKLGQGGMGSVYLARDRRLSTASWAVKEMSDAVATSAAERQQFSEAFRQEAELLARLGHPNLPRVTDHFEENGKNYLVMELVPGETLLSRIQQMGLPVPFDLALDWARQICDVLAYLHGQRPPIIFRDLKPANIMVTPEGTLKLIDFGIARLFKPGQARDTQAYGTMGYSAPEQYGRGQTDARSDIYSLAVLVHQLLTGHDPAATPFRLPSADQVNPLVPAQMAAVLARATDNDPDRRFATVGEFKAALLGSGALIRRDADSPRTQPALGVNGGPPPATGGQAASQPFPPPPPASTGPAAPAVTTPVAAVSMWLGIASAGLMLLALILMASVGFDSSSPVSGFAVLLTVPPICTGPVAGVMGLIALLRTQTGLTTRGRRDAAIGLAAGTVTLLLCCAIVSLIGSTGSTQTETSLVWPHLAALASLSGGI